MARRSVGDEGRAKQRRPETTNRSRRKLLGAVAVGGGAVLAGTTLPRNWTKPIVDSVVLPLHAQASAPLASAYATTGVGGTISDLYSINVATGATVLVGSVGFAVNAIALYNGTLYGLERQGGALLTINTATGAGTSIGSLGGDNVTSFTISSAGDGYGWSEDNDSFRSVDIGTGATAQIGSGTSSASHGMAFLGGTLYFHNYDGNVYTIDTGTGAMTLVGNTGLGREAITGASIPRTVSTTA